MATMAFIRGRSPIRLKRLFSYLAAPSDELYSSGDWFERESLFVVTVSHYADD